MSIAPEKVFGPGGEAEKRALALSAFTALAGKKQFHEPFGEFVGRGLKGYAVSAPGGKLDREALLLRIERDAGRNPSSGLLFVVSVFVYGYEIAIGVQMLSRPFDPTLMTALALILGVLNRIGARLGTAGKPQGRGPFSILTAWLEKRTQPHKTLRIGRNLIPTYRPSRAWSSSSRRVGSVVERRMLRSTLLAILRARSRGP